MKLVEIGDIHGRARWKEIIDKENPDITVFIGDYWDSFDIPYEKQKNNWLDILEYKRQNRDKVFCLIGNHDYHYMMMDYGERYSGFQKAPSWDIRTAVIKALDTGLIQTAYIRDNIVFTHAGVTKSWLIDRMGRYPELAAEGDLDHFLNELMKARPLEFRLYEGDRSCCGEHIMSSPIWVRPQALYEDRYNIFSGVQVVGHTYVERITPPKGDHNLWFTDALGTGQYLKIEDGVFTPMQLELKSA